MGGRLVLALAAACGTDAVGVSECRQIEAVRCRAAVSCGFDNEPDCLLFSRDDCLHGLGGASPSATQLEACLGAIAEAGRCASSEGGDTAPSACSIPIAASAEATDVCDLIVRPERAQECRFLVEPPPAESESEPSARDAAAHVAPARLLGGEPALSGGLR